MQNKRYNLEERFVDYTCSMIDLVEALPATRSGNYIASQLIRSCHAPAFNYAETQAAESKKDFIHKMGIVLKELKECRIALKLIGKKQMVKPASQLEAAGKETEELIAITGKSISTARKNNSKTAGT